MDLTKDIQSRATVLRLVFSGMFVPSVLKTIAYAAAKHPFSRAEVIAVICYDKYSLCIAASVFKCVR